MELNYIQIQTQIQIQIQIYKVEYIYFIFIFILKYFYGYLTNENKTFRNTSFSEFTTRIGSSYKLIFILSIPCMQYTAYFLSNTNTSTFLFL